MVSTTSEADPGSSAPPAPRDDPLSDAAVNAALAACTDLQPLVHAAFECGDLAAYAEALGRAAERQRGLAAKVAAAHHEELARSVQSLATLRDATESLAAAVDEGARAVRDEAAPLVEHLKRVAADRQEATELAAVAAAAERAGAALDALAAIDEDVDEARFVRALRRVDELTGWVDWVESDCVRDFLLKRVPETRQRVRRAALAEAGDWLVAAREGAAAVGHDMFAAAAEKRRARAASRERQNATLRAIRAGRVPECSLATDEPREQDPLKALVFTPLHKCRHVFSLLGEAEWFADYYWKQRCLQGASDLENVGRCFIESYQPYLAQVVGSFVIDMRASQETDGALVSTAQLDAAWEGAAASISALLVREFHALREPTQLLLLCDFMSLLPSVLCDVLGLRAGLLDGAMESASERYHELIERDALDTIVSTSARAPTMLVAATHRDRHAFEMAGALGLHECGVAAPGAFPATARHSELALKFARTVRELVDDSAGFHRAMQSDRPETSFRAVSKRLSTFLVRAVDEVLIPMTARPDLSQTHVMLLQSDAMALHGLMSALDDRVNSSLGCSTRPTLPDSQHDGALASLDRLCATARDRLVAMIVEKLDEALSADANWAPDQPRKGPSELARTTLATLEVTLQKALALMPTPVAETLCRSALEAAAGSLLRPLVGTSIKSFNMYAIIGLDTDVQLLEGVADRLPVGNLRQCLVEPRELVDMLLANEPERMMEGFCDVGSGIADAPAMNPSRLAAILDKYVELKPSLLGGRTSRFPKRAAIQAVVQQLRKLSAST